MTRKKHPLFLSTKTKINFYLKKIREANLRRKTLKSKKRKNQEILLPPKKTSLIKAFPKSKPQKTTQFL